MSAAILEARGLQAVRGGVQVLAIPELRVQEGSVLALIGPNGSGKSSLLLALAGLIPAAGEIAFRGVPIGPAGDGSGYRRRVTMVFQDPLLFDATVRENIASGLRLRRLPRAELDARVQESAERFGIAPMRRYSRRLSRLWRVGLLRLRCWGKMSMHIHQAQSAKRKAQSLSVKRKAEPLRLVLLNCWG